MMKINKTHIAQIVLITFLGFALIAPIAPADAVTIALQGQIDPETIDISINTATLNLDVSTGQTSKSDTIEVSSTAIIPVKMTLESVTHKTESWSPTLIAEDPTMLGLADAQNKARFSLNSNIADANYAVAPPAQVIPTGTGSTLASGEYPVHLGTIADTDGVTAKKVTITGTLEVNKKRILSKAFNTEMVLNFAATK